MKLDEVVLDEKCPTCKARPNEFCKIYNLLGKEILETERMIHITRIKKAVKRHIEK